MPILLLHIIVGRLSYTFTTRVNNTLHSQCIQPCLCASFTLGAGHTSCMLQHKQWAESVNTWADWAVETWYVVWWEKWGKGWIRQDRFKHNSTPTHPPGASHMSVCCTVLCWGFSCEYLLHSFSLFTSFQRYCSKWVIPCRLISWVRRAGELSTSALLWNGSRLQLLL